MATQEQPEIPTPVRVWGQNGDQPPSHPCIIRLRVLYGFMTLHYDPQDLRICLRTGDGREHIMRLPWAKLADALEFNGEAVALHFDETTLDGEVVDRTVFSMMDVDPGLVRDPAEVRRELEAYWEENGIKPMTLTEVAQGLRDVFDSDEEREAFANSIRERRNGTDADGR